VNEALRAVVIGAGDMGERHARHWRAAGATVLAVVDPDAARAAASAAVVGAAAMADRDEALALAPDVVSVCTPTFVHAAATIAALRAGAHVLCEKPVSLTLAEAFAMRDAAASCGRELRIGFMRRFDPATPALSAALTRIGAPLYAQATIAAGLRPKRMMHDRDGNGGPLIDMACHVFDFWAGLYGGAPERVSAHGTAFAAGRPEVAHIRHVAIDTAQVTLDYGARGAAQMQISWGLPSGVEATERHAYVGAHGSVEVAWAREITVRDGAGVTRFTPTEGDPWQREIAQFHAELTRGAPVTTAGIEAGIAALRISLAALRSIASGTPVAPDDLGEVTA
jgi:myo-inositol 2-dehydrogenase / D-chiro-inositol 1-dehydrogenase